MIEKFYDVLYQDNKDTKIKVWLFKRKSGFDFDKAVLTGLLNGDEDMFRYSVTPNGWRIDCKELGKCGFDTIDYHEKGRSLMTSTRVNAISSEIREWVQNRGW